MKKLKDKILEIVKISQECPENFQSICFEVLLKHELLLDKKPLPRDGVDTPPPRDQGKQEPKGNIEGDAKKQDDLTDADLHIKMRKFLGNNALNINHINQLFYKEGDKILPLYENLKTTKISESQMRITLLQCLHGAIDTGDFQTEVESARQEAITRKCYDSGNWGTNYSNNATLFDFEKYSKKLETITLSEEGKSELAKLIKELQ